MDLVSTSAVWKEFSDNFITHSAAHHLLAILELSTKQGYARVSDVARYLDITTGSVSTNLKALKEKKLVLEDDNRFVSLSEEGKSFAHAILMRRQLLRRLFSDVLGVDHKQAQIDSCKMEHLLSAETTSKLAKFMLGGSDLDVSKKVLAEALKETLSDEDAQESLEEATES